MSSAENGRLVWLSKEQRDWFERYTIVHSVPNTEWVAGLAGAAVSAWDRAPEDAVAAVEAALRYLLCDDLGRGVLDLEEFEYYVAAVLTALCPPPPSWLSEQA